MLIETKEKAKWTVYIHIVPKAISNYDYDKYYVGITSQSPQTRWGKNGYRYTHKQDSLFGRAILKYGWDNIEHIVFADKLTISEAKKMEITLIDKLDSCGDHGYNLTRGGDFTESISNINKYYQFSTDGTFIQSYPNRKDIGKKYGFHIDNIALHAKRHTQYGNWFFAREEDVVKDGETFKLKNISIWKKHDTIFHFDLNGTFIAEYSSIKKAHLSTGINYGTIYSDVHGIKKRSYKSIFRYSSDVDFSDGIPKPKDYFENEVFHFDSRGEFIALYKNLDEASGKTGYSKSMIQGQINENRFPKKGAIFKRSKDVVATGNGYSIIDFDKIFLRSIYQFDCDLNFIRKYKSIDDAVTKTGVKRDRITLSANSKKYVNCSNGYNWRYEEDVIFENDKCYIEAPPTNIPQKRKKIYQFDSNGFVGVYISISCAEKVVGIKANTIYQSAQKHYMPSKTFAWRYEEDVQELPDGSFLMLR